MLNIIKGGSSSNQYVDGMHLVNRQGQTVDESYIGKKYKVISVDKEYYSTHERIARFCKAFFQVLFTLGFVLCNQNKRKELHDLFSKTLKSQSVTATRYTSNNRDQIKHVSTFLHKEGWATRFKNNCSLEEFKQKCKDVGYCINFDEWDEAAIICLIKTQSVEFVAHLLKTNKGKKDILNNALRDTIYDQFHSLWDNEDKKQKIEHLCSIIKALAASGADLNQRYYDRSRSNIIDTHYYVYGRSRSNIIDTRHYGETLLSTLLQNIPYHYPNYKNLTSIEPLLADIQSIIALLVSLGAKTTDKLKSDTDDENRALRATMRTRSWQPDENDNIMKDLLKNVAATIEARRPFINLLLAHQDEGSNFAQLLPREMIMEIAQRMLRPAA